MGHYYSEMVSDEERRQEREHKERVRQRKTKELKELIKKHGLERSIVEYLERI